MLTFINEKFDGIILLNFLYIFNRMEKNFNESFIWSFFLFLSSY